jgi:hypothetical protein
MESKEDGWSRVAQQIFLMRRVETYWKFNFSSMSGVGALGPAMAGDTDMARERGG